MELLRTLGALAEPPVEAHARLGRLLELEGDPDPVEHTELFAFQLYPYASVFLGPEGMLGGDARDRVAGFWRALGLVPPPEPDHLTTLVALYASIAEHEGQEAEPAARALWTQARRALLWEHLLPWLPAYLDRVEELSGPFYAGWARLLRSTLVEELGTFGGESQLPLHLREAPGVADPREEGGEAFLGALLAPVRSGMILCRADLARSARELGLGLRIGERAYVLKALLSQEPAAVLEWLAREARRSRERHGGWPAGMEEITGFWLGRAEATAMLLESLASERREEARWGGPAAGPPDVPEANGVAATCPDDSAAV